MTDLMTRVRGALRTYEEGDATWADFAPFAPEMAQALIDETERRERIERAAQWVLDNPIAHPENVRAVISKAMEE